MTLEDKQDDKLPLDQNGEEDMATIPCVACGVEHRLNNVYESSAWGDSPHYNDVIKGVLYCGSCEAPTVFTMKANAPIFLPGKLLQQNLVTGKNANAEGMIQEALKCFYGGSYVGVVAMCRSAVVEAILGKNVGARKD